MKKGKKAVKAKKVVKKAKAKKVVVKRRSVGNQYAVEKKGKSHAISALKILADGKERIDKATLSTKQVAELKVKFKKFQKDPNSKEFSQAVHEMLTKPLKVDSQAKKQGETRNTGYDPTRAIAVGLCS